MTTKFKIGDKVRRINSSNEGVSVGEVAEVIGFSGSCALIDKGNQGNGYGHDLDNLELVSSINNNQSNTNMLEKFKIMLKGEPQKSFCKAGITDVNYNLTDDGKEIFSQWLLKKFGDDFKLEVVDELLKDIK